MLYAILIGCALLGDDASASSKTAADRAAYESAQAKAGKDAAANVRLALWCEQHGLSAERAKHLALAIAYDPKVAADPVAQHMTKDVISVACGDPLSRVADLFIIHRIRRLFVLDEGKLVGVISRRDLLKAARNSRDALTTSSPFAARVSQSRALLPEAAV